MGISREGEFEPRETFADLKEAYNMTLIDDKGAMPLDIVPDFYNAFKEMFTLSQELGSRVLDLMSIDVNVKPGQVRCGEHSDYGSITLLFQDDIGGLEVKPTGRDYIPATPMHGTVLVILGDLMQRWTTDKFIATKHRILIPEKEVTQKKGRQSLAYFFHPDYDLMIKCLDGSGKYEKISSIDYLNMRFAATY